MATFSLFFPLRLSCIIWLVFVLTLKWGITIATVCTKQPMRALTILKSNFKVSANLTFLSVSRVFCDCFTEDWTLHMIVYTIQQWLEKISNICSFVFIAQRWHKPRAYMRVNCTLNCNDYSVMIVIMLTVGTPSWGSSYGKLCCLDVLYRNLRCPTSTLIVDIILWPRLVSLMALPVYIFVFLGRLVVWRQRAAGRLVV